MTGSRTITEPSPVPPLADVFAVIVPILTNTFERWQDEHAYESRDFCAMFDAALRPLGCRVSAVTGSRRRMVITAEWPSTVRVITAKLSRGMLAVDAQRRDR